MQQDAMPIRMQVFVQEQQVPAELEMDDFDVVSLHAVAYTKEGEPAGTGRLLPDGHIGRMAVHLAERGAGVGGMLLRTLMQAAQARGDTAVVLSAQIQAKGFYQRHGFMQEGVEFMDAGIAHIQMRHVFEAPKK